jgi:phospholipase/carboxylesterase
MHQTVREVAGLRTLIAGEREARLTLVLLHGYGMRAEDFAPFSRSLGLPLRFLLPQGPVRAAGGGYGWWVSSLEEAGFAVAPVPRDLAQLEPPGLAAAHAQLHAFLTAAAAEFEAQQWVLGGFSQGGMLALDLALRGAPLPAALVLLSASRIAFPRWAPQQHRLEGLPVFMSHGKSDPDLAFHAGEALRDFAIAGGARVAWLPFEGGHEIPLIVWRGLRKFLRGLLACVR